MLKILVKKQLTEIWRGFFYDAKNNKGRSRASTVGLFILFFLLSFGVIGGMMTGMAWTICPPLLEAGFGWLYYTLMSSLAVVLGVFVSAFSTYQGLYLSKDNDLLLALPIPVRTILLARMTGVWLMGTAYCAVVCVPAVVVYGIHAGFSAAVALGGLVWFLSLSVFVLSLSCALGWAVARVSVRLKNKSYVSVLLSLLFFGLYYFVYFKAQEWIRVLIENAAVYGEKIRESALPLYALGRAGEGAPLPLLGIAVFAAVVFVPVWILVSRSFLRVSAAPAEKKKAGRAVRAQKVRTPDGALFGREMKRFTSNANYMLNAGLGLLFLPAAGVALLIKGKDLTAMMADVFGERPGCTAALLCAVASLLATLVDITGPSVSLEAKTLWISHSLPVLPWQCLRAKLRLQLVLLLPPLVFTAACVGLAADGPLAARILAFLVPVLNGVFFTLLGLAVGVKRPTLQWTNEIVPIKQSAAVMIVTLGGMGFGAVMGGLYFLLGAFVPVTVYLAVFAVGLAAGSLFLYRWLRQKGAALYAAL